ncbi:forkhead box protein P1 isoform X5 [Atheta coriaria]|uniref:forkhead box protein P1 isoform X5 n=1 Tax=Dalotia coriaria TaxID=877792 RepID=UPI0031F40FB3
MLEPRWRPVQGHLGGNPFDSDGVGWTKNHYSPATTPWPHHALRQSRYSDDGIMDQDVDGDGAINLSTSQRPSAATTPNDGIQPEDVEQQAASLEKVLKEQQQQQQQLKLERAWDQEDRDANGNGSTSPGSDAAARHHDHSPPPAALTSDAQKALNAAIPVSQAQVGSHPPMMSSPVSGLHHMQQLLQQHVLNPSQLQNLMKQHSLLQQQQHQHQLAEIGKKQMEQTIQQLQEQLQLNLIQQTHILQSGDKKKAPGSLQQLSIQQQQLIQQLQLIQRQYVVHQGMGMQPLMLPQPTGLGSRDVMSPWKESNPDRDHPNNNTPNELNGLLGALTPGRTSREDSIVDDKPDAASNSTPDRVHHLYGHGVCKWAGCEAICDDLPTFMKHLNTEHTLDDRSTAQARVQMQVVSQLELQLQKERDRLQAMMHHLHLAKQMGTPEPNLHGDLTSGGGGTTPSSKLPSGSSVSQPPVSLSSLVTAARFPVLQQNQTNVAGPIRRRISDKSALSLAGGLPYMLERAGLDVQQEIQRNREFYKNADIRPPFTYASLIRQSIIESPDKQLTLNEIYNWFQNTFCYFRRNAATWKNAVRHNLSLHKCFMRVENVKGAVWTVDEVEFYKRRPQRCSSGPLALPVVGGASKSPAMKHSPPMYGESLPSNLQYSQAPLLEESLAFTSGAGNMERQRECSESPNHDLIRSPMNGSLHIKQESLMTPEHPHHPHLGQPQQHHHGSEASHHIIKREMHHDYDNVDQDAHTDGGMAEDLTVGQDHAGGGDT